MTQPSNEPERKGQSSKLQMVAIKNRNPRHRSPPD
jgi:hypothetical protein